MKDILLASHGNLAIGLKHTLEFFLGESDQITAISAYLDSTDNYKLDIRNFIDSHNEQNSIIFTDIYGGSVNQQVVALMIESGKNIPIITNMNLPVIMSIALSDGNIKDVLNDCEPKLISIEVNDREEEDLDEFFN